MPGTQLVNTIDAYQAESSGKLVDPDKRGRRAARRRKDNDGGRVLEFRSVEILPHVP